MRFPAFDPIDLKNSERSDSMVELYLSQIEPNQNQPRKNFDVGSLEELALSIRQHGIIQPILVRQLTNGCNYQIIAGERRWRAAKMVGLEKIPVIIKEHDKINNLAIALIENIQRENLNPLEEAQAIQRLLEECALTHHQVAESIGRSRTAVSNLLRLLMLHDEVKSMINLGLLEMGHARALLSLEDTKQIETAKLVVDKTLSVRETEKLVQRINVPQETQNVSLDPIFERKALSWTTKLSKQLSSKVNLQVSDDGKGKIVVHFDSLDEADWLIDHIGFVAHND